MFFRPTLFIVLGIAFFGTAVDYAQTSDDDESTIPRHLSTMLSHNGAAPIRYYEPDEMPPKAILIFGSGDGGWSAWEDAVSRSLRDAKVLVVGFDCRKYSASDYDATKL